MPDDGDEKKEPLAECTQCHARVPERQLVRLYGKHLCYGCATSWYDEDQDEEPDK